MDARDVEERALVDRNAACPRTLLGHVRPPRELTPAFFGCYDWHSAVHGHWLLARLARTFPEAAFAPKARAALGQSLTPSKISAE